MVKSGKVKSGKLGGYINEKDKKILLELRDNPEGIRVNTIEKITGIPKRTVYRILKKYEKKKLIENIYPLWKRLNGQSDFWQTLSGSSEIFELHNLSYVLKLIKKPDWWNQKKKRLMRLKDWQFSNHNFGKNHNNPFQQIINDNYVIQFYPESITIMHRKRFYSNNPYELLQEGIIKTLEIIEFLEERFRFKFLQNGIPALEIRGSHFNRIKDFIAEKCKSDGRRFLVETEVGKVWVDYSEPFGKESDTPDIQYQLEKVTKDFIEKKPKLNSELQKDIEELRTDTLLEIKKNSEVSMDISLAMKQMQSNIAGLTETVYQLIEVIKSGRDKD